MAETSWPFDDQDSSESQYSLLLGQAIDTGVLPDQAGPDGSALRPYGDSSGMFVKIPAGTAIVRGFAYRNDSLLTLAVPASGGATRIDSVVLRLDLAANRTNAVLKQGDVGGAPALTQVDGGVWEVRLADITVPASSTTVAAGQVADRRSFSSLPWGTWSNGSRPSSAAFGKAGVNKATGPEWWDGGQWRSFSTTTTNASQLTAGTLGEDRLPFGVVATVRGGRGIDAPLINGDTVNGDWDYVRSPGVYRTWDQAGNFNQPSGSPDLNGTLTVLVGGSNAESKTQIYTEASGNGRTYIRSMWSGGNSWNGWQRLVRSGELAAYYPRTDVDGAFATRDSRIGTLENNRTVNLSNATKIAAGSATANNFSSTGYGGTSAFSGYVDVTWPGMAVVSVTATPQSGDTGGCTASVTNLAGGGCRIVLVRRNNTATGVSWLAVGN